MNDFEPWGFGFLGPVLVLLLTLGAYESLRPVSSVGYRTVGVLGVLTASLVLTVGVTGGDVVPPYQLLMELLLPAGAVVWGAAEGSRRIRPRRRPR